MLVVPISNFIFTIKENYFLKFWQVHLSETFKQVFFGLLQVLNEDFAMLCTAIDNQIS